MKISILLSLLALSYAVLTAIDVDADGDFDILADVRPVVPQYLQGPVGYAPEMFVTQPAVATMVEHEEVI